MVRRYHGFLLRSTCKEKNKDDHERRDHVGRGEAAEI